jgi:hypothetical protein
MTQDSKGHTCSLVTEFTGDSSSARVTEFHPRAIRSMQDAQSRGYLRLNSPSHLFRPTFHFTNGETEAQRGNDLPVSSGQGEFP